MDRIGRGSIRTLPLVIKLWCFLKTHPLKQDAAQYIKIVLEIDGIILFGINNVCFQEKVLIKITLKGGNVNKQIT